jgi:Tol biopolymer transport system component
MDSAPSWAPNNEEIAFVRGAGNEAEIYAISTDQKSLTRLTNNKYYDGEPGWKP